MTADLPPDTIELEVVPAPEYVSTVRLLVAATARHFGVDEEVVADLKMAISEACTEAIDFTGPLPRERPIRVVLAPRGDLLDIQLVAPGMGFGPLAGPADIDATPRSFERTLRASVIHALFPDAVVVHAGEEALGVRFQLPRGLDQA